MTCGSNVRPASFLYQGAWTTGRVYQANDTVTHGGSSFICILGHTSDVAGLGTPFNEPEAGSDWTTYWNYLAEGGEALIWKGEWSDLATYVANDVVEWEGSSWVAPTGAGIGHEPGVSALWDLVAQSGRDTGFEYTYEATLNADPGTTPPVTGTIETNDGDLATCTNVYAASVDRGFPGNTPPVAGQDRQADMENWLTTNLTGHGTLLLRSQAGATLASWEYTDVTIGATGYVGFTVTPNAQNATPIDDVSIVHISVLQRGDAGVPSIFTVEPCVAATTGDITLSGAQTVDGISPSDTDRILVWQQATTSENGVYAYDGAGAWTRVSDLTADGQFIDGLLVTVQSGDTQADSLFQLLTQGIAAPRFARRDGQGIVPEFYGAKGDGATNDAVALQAWLDAIPASGTFGRLPAKTYRTGTTLDVPDLARIIGDPGAGDGVSGSVIRSTGVFGPIIQCGPTSGTVTETAHIEGLTVNGNDPTTGAGTGAGVRCRNMQNSTFKHLRIFNCVGAGMLTETDVTQAEGTAFNQRNFIDDITCNNNGGKGMHFIGEKDTRFDNLYARNNTGDGIQWEASASSASGATSETTQCVIGKALSRGNGGHGFILDGTEKYNMGELTATSNVLKGIEFRTSNKEATGSVGLNGAVIGGIVLRKNKGGGINMVTGARVSGLQIGSLKIIGGDIDPVNDPELLRNVDGIVLRAAAKVHIGTCQISAYGGNGVVLRQDTPIDGGLEECRDIRFDDLEIFGNGNPDSDLTGARGLRILHSTTRVSIGRFRSTNNDTTAFDELDISASATEINIADSSIISESGVNAVSDPGGALTVYGRDVREAVPQGVGKAPVVVALLTPSSNNYAVPAGVLYLKVKLVGGGGGAAGSASGGGLTNGVIGGATTFGTAFLTGNPGGPGIAATDNGGGAGGTATGGDINIRGSNGGGSLTLDNELNTGGLGGIGPLGGVGAGSCGVAPGSGTNVNTLGDAAANSGSGGSGGGGDIDIANGGSGGGAGGYLEKLISSPDADYDYTVGAGGAGGGRGQLAPDIGVGGGVGGSGFIIIEEHYQ